MILLKNKKDYVDNNFTYNFAEDTKLVNMYIFNEILSFFVLTSFSPFHRPLFYIFLLKPVNRQTDGRVDM